ncbi:MAG TPA: hypothetical protein VG796_07085 [Verrucomicrobiales bacterium]|nr:hypothetical protein [Verrucomicrobiales bacterium]
MKKAKSKFPIRLNRFTSLPVLLDILRKRHLVLLSPETWADRNDAYYVERYREQKKLKTVLALCFSTASQTFHHWKVFSDGSGGVCIEFDGARLIPHLQQNGIRCRLVDYKSIAEVESSMPDTDDWPFLKREPYRDEGEFRLVYESRQRDEQSKSIQIDLSWINKITLSPWMPKPVADSVIEVLNLQPDCDQLSIKKSLLLENNRWKRAINPTLKNA